MPRPPVKVEFVSLLGCLRSPRQGRMTPRDNRGSVGRGSLTSRASRLSKQTPFRRAKATSEQGQPGVRCPLTKERSGVVSLPSEPPGRASPTSALLSLLKFAGVSNCQASTSPTFSPLVYRVEGSTEPTMVRLVRSAYKWTRCARADRLLVYEVRSGRLSLAREAPRAGEGDQS
jgi:hypothetical protein